MSGTEKLSEILDNFESSLPLKHRAEFRRIRAGLEKLREQRNWALERYWDDVVPTHVIPDDDEEILKLMRDE